MTPQGPSKGIRKVVAFQGISDEIHQELEPDAREQLLPIGVGRLVDIPETHREAGHVVSWLRVSGDVRQEDQSGWSQGSDGPWPLDIQVVLTGIMSRTNREPLGLSGRATANSPVGTPQARNLSRLHQSRRLSSKETRFRDATQTLMGPAGDPAGFPLSVCGDHSNEQLESG